MHDACTNACTCAHISTPDMLGLFTTDIKAYGFHRNIYLVHCFPGPYSIMFCVRFSQRKVNIMASFTRSQRRSDRNKHFTKKFSTNAAPHIEKMLQNERDIVKISLTRDGGKNS